MAPPPPWRNSKNPEKSSFLAPTWRSIRIGIPKSIHQSGEVFGFPRFVSASALLACVVEQPQRQLLLDRVFAKQPDHAGDLISTVRSQRR
jgi:hypothetical protein